MTREAFERFVSEHSASITVAPPYKVVACACGDINCHGWRIVRDLDLVLVPREDVVAVEDIITDYVDCPEVWSETCARLRTIAGLEPRS